MVGGEVSLEAEGHYVFTKVHVEARVKLEKGEAKSLRGLQCMKRYSIGNQAGISLISQPV